MGLCYHNRIQAIGLHFGYDYIPFYSFRSLNSFRQDWFRDSWLISKATLLCWIVWQGGRIPAPIVIYLFPWRFSLYPILPTSSTDFLLYPRALQPPGWDNFLCFLKSTQIFLPSSTSNFYPWGEKKKMDAQNWTWWAYHSHNPQEEREKKGFPLIRM